MFCPRNEFKHFRTMTATPSVTGDIQLQVLAPLGLVLDPLGQGVPGGSRPPGTEPPVRRSEWSRGVPPMS